MGTESVLREDLWRIGQEVPRRHFGLQRGGNQGFRVQGPERRQTTPGEKQGQGRRHDFTVPGRGAIRSYPREAREVEQEGATGEFQFILFDMNEILMLQWKNVAKRYQSNYHDNKQILYDLLRKLFENDDHSGKKNIDFVTHFINQESWTTTRFHYFVI